MAQDKPSPPPFFGHRTQSDRESPYGSLWKILLLLLVVWWLSSIFFANGQDRKIDYSAFREQLKQGNVERVTVQGEQLQGSLRDPVTVNLEGNRTAEYQDFITYLPSFGDDQLLTLLEDKEVAVTTEPEQDFSWVWILLTTLPFLLFFGLIYMQYRRMSGGKGGPGGIFSFGKSKARLFDRSTEQTTFDDVAGAEGAKEELKEIVAYLKNPEDIEKLGAEVPKGMLLVGPPGCGKTLLARAVAGESRVPFYSISGSDFMEMFVGVGASRVRDMFKAAKKDAPSIIFIDELDSIGRRRGAGLGGGHDEREQTLNQLLHELDGFEPNENVIVMSATNRPDILDQALLRPGRFDRRVVVDMPRSKDRLAILKLYAKDKPLAEDVDLEDLARNTPGFSGADLENLLNEAALLAARHQRDRILNEDIEEARDKVILGLQRQGLVMTDEERRFVAYHEAGHAVVAALLPHTDPVHKVSIIPRTRSMGVTQQFPEKEQYIYREEYMLDRLAVMMGGRASEELVFSTTTSGAGEDLKQATKLVRRMILEWGMGDRFRHMALGSEREQVFLGEQIAQGREYSDSTAREVDEVVQDVLNRAFDRARKTLAEHRQGLDQLAETLLDQDEVAGEEVLEILGISEQQEGQSDTAGKGEQP